ncbi:MAG: hypothetical protein ACTSYB_11270 [Candidatus Helarchaeota archaeon]
MTGKQQIRLKWIENYAKVIEKNGAKTYEIGTVFLKTLYTAVVGCTYYHHLATVSEKREMKEIQQIKKANARKIADLQRRYPEISAEHIVIDNTGGWYHIDLVIPIKFGLPLLITEPYKEMVRERLAFYVNLLKENHLVDRSIEIVKLEDEG